MVAAGPLKRTSEKAVSASKDDLHEALEFL